MAVPRLRPLLVLAGLALAATLACDRGTSSPALGFTYNWGDSLLEAFAQAEVDRTRPPGGDSIRLLASRDGGWSAYGSSPLVAEVARASILAETPEVVAVVGPGGSREALQVARIYAEAGVPNLVPTATSRLLTSAGALTYLLAPNDSVQGEFIVAFADSALSARTLLVFYVPDEYGIGLAAGVEAASARRGLALQARTPMRLTQACVGTPDGQAYYAGLAEEARRRPAPSAVVIAARTVEVACLATALRKLWPEQAILAGDGVYLDTPFFESAGAGTDGIYLVAFWHPQIPNARSRDFAQRFRAATGREARHGEAVYVDAALLAATALRESAGSREAVRRYLDALGRSRPAYDGITGPISFTPGARRPLWMTRVRGDSSVLLVESP